jgi:electron transfer flavoprotein alpha subunit
MEKILFIGYVEADGALPKASYEALGAAVALAKELSASLEVGLIGAHVADAAASIGGCGADAFHAVSGPDFAAARYASDAAAAEAICKAAGPSITLAAATSRASRALPGVAQRLDGRIDTNATALAVDGGKPVVTRWYYRQRMFGQLSREQRPWIITLAGGCCAPYQGAAQAPSLTPLDVALPEAAKRTTIVGVEAPAADQQTIRPDAKLLLVAGAGWTKKQADGQVHAQDASDAILGFLDQTKASLGSSKSLVDQSGEGAVLPFLTHLHQVGQTGATPRHQKGLATCCHGEEPHVVGWRFITERRAVNLDGNCGWAQGKADVLYVADAFAVMKKVNELLKG